MDHPRVSHQTGGNPYFLFSFFFSFLFLSLPCWEGLRGRGSGGAPPRNTWSGLTGYHRQPRENTPGERRHESKAVCGFFFSSPLGGRALLSYGLRNYSCASLMIRSRPSWQCLTRQCLEMASLQANPFFYVRLTVCRMM